MNDIRKMEAGPELDGMVLRLVFGDTRDVEPNNFFRDAELHEWRMAHPNRVRDVPPYSTDIAAAWEVVEWLSHNAEEVAVGHTNDGWDCDIWFFQQLENNHAIHGTSETAPLAICRAALLAVMGQE